MARLRENEIQNPRRVQKEDTPLAPATSPPFLARGAREIAQETNAGLLSRIYLREWSFYRSKLLDSLTDGRLIVSGGSREKDLRERSILITDKITIKSEGTDKISAG